MPPKADKLTVTTNGEQTQSINNGEVNCRQSYYDKQSGSYSRVTTKESVSSGDYSNRGRSGHKVEYKTDTTVRIGDKKGYTEEKLTGVEYDEGTNNFGGNKNGVSDDVIYIIYGDGDGDYGASDKKGYTEYSKQEKLTGVEYDGGTNNFGVNKNGFSDDDIMYIIYGDGDYGASDDDTVYSDGDYGASDDDTIYSDGDYGASDDDTVISDGDYGASDDDTVYSGGDYDGFDDDDNDDFDDDGGYSDDYYNSDD